MRHPHEVKEAEFQITYEHDDAPSWHIDHGDEDHDHPLAVMVIEGKVSVTAETPQGDRFIHAVT